MDLRKSIFSSFYEEGLKDEEFLKRIESYFVCVTKMFGMQWEIPVHQLKTAKPLQSLPGTLCWCVKVDRTTPEELDYEIVFFLTNDEKDNITGMEISVKPWPIESDYHKGGNFV